MTYREYNFDGLVGPTHNYAGLGSGNLASIGSRHHVSHPKAAALEGLAKMKLLAEMGIPQAVLPPQRRPHLGYLRSCGYGKSPGATGSPGGEPVSGEAPGHKLPQTASRGTPEVAAILRDAAEGGEGGWRDLAIASSASSMWAANAATVSPSPDTMDGRCHFTIANLASQRHRALESLERLTVFEHLFGDEKYFKVHEPLPSTLPDEGAANHTRLCDTRSYDGDALEVFTFGREKSDDRRGSKFIPRQLRQASRQVAANHDLPYHDYHEDGEFLVRQSPHAVAAGVFHNDVACVANQNVLLIHARAWEDQQRHLEEIDWLMCALCVSFLDAIVITNEELPLPDAVRSYLFNSQLVTLPDGSMALIYPAECDEVPTAKAAIERILREDNPVEKAVRVDVRQSMKNGGGPACLRLRVVLSDEEKAAVRGNVFWSPELHETLVAWVDRHYRESLTPRDLADVRLYEESEAALDELGEILQLPI